MKKCPYCAEEILDDAVKCKHCGSDLTKPAKAVPAKKTSNTAIGCVVILVICIAVAIIGQGVIWAGKEVNKISTWKKAKIEGLCIAHPNWSKGCKKIADDKVKALLDAANNQRARHDYDNAIRNYRSLINTYPTSAEAAKAKEILAGIDKEKADFEAEFKAEQLAKQKASAEQRLAKQAKELAAQKAWDNSKAGGICKKHPKWTMGDCWGVAAGEYWVGMSYEMLIYERGLPNHANPSNYGNGTSWQWCWDDMTPSCFYDKDNDGIIDAYN